MGVRAADRNTTSVPFRWGLMRFLLYLNGRFGRTRGIGKVAKRSWFRCGAEGEENRPAEEEGIGTPGRPRAASGPIPSRLLLATRGGANAQLSGLAVGKGPVCSGKA